MEKNNLKMTSITKNRIIKIILSITSIIFIIMLWMITSKIYDNELIFPPLNKILTSLLNIFKSKEAIKPILYTIFRVLASVLICFIIGIFITSLYIIYKPSISLFMPMIKMMRSLPIAVISIFIFIIIGDKIGPYIITILMSLPVIIEGLITAASEINQSIVEEMKLLKGSIFTKLFKMYIPLIKPYIVMAIIQTLGMSFKVMVMGEYICQTNNSIGKTLYNFKTSIEMNNLVAYGILIIIIVSLLELLIYIQKQKLIKRSK